METGMQGTALRKVKGIYNAHTKRILDMVISAAAIVLLSPVFLLLAVLIKINLGSPVIFRQKRPGLNEKIFEIKKFRTMTDARGKNGRLLPDEARLTRFGKWLRSTSLDELPELFNVLEGDMSLVGPRPQLVKDLVFMSPLQRKRHLVKPGITGLAQISGRNGISWEKKLRTDLSYIKQINIITDIWILWRTAGKVIKREGINADNMETAENYGDYLFRTGKINKEIYDKNMKKAGKLLEG